MLYLLTQKAYFYVRRCMRLHPALLTGLIISLSGTVLTLIFFLQLSYLNQEMRVDLKRLVSRLSLVQEQKKQLEASHLPPIQLPHFESSDLVEKLNAIAKAEGVVVDEISYVLDESPDQAYRRYRVNFSTVSKYILIRKMIQSLNQQIQHLALDGMSCSRDNVGDANLTCELTLSAYFSRG